jgi:outer membrane protein assembly factor BamE (lipoprotein component of BamABCDE complex)
MFKILKIVLFISFISMLSNCSEKVTYSGKIFKEVKVDYSKIKTNQDMIDLIGYPSFVDPIENKFYYFTEKKNTKNFFNEKVTERQLIVFKFDKNDNIEILEEFNLDDENQIKLIEETTPNKIIKRGLIEKIFGGVGKSSIPNTTQ